MSLPALLPLVSRGILGLVGRSRLTVDECSRSNRDIRQKKFVVGSTYRLGVDAYVGGGSVEVDDVPVSGCVPFAGGSVSIG